MGSPSVRAVGLGGAGGRHICFIFTRGRKRVIQSAQSFVAWGSGGGRGDGALGMMKRLNLLFPCNQFVNARLSIISFKTDLLEHLSLMLQGTAPRALSIGDSGGRRARGAARRDCPLCSVTHCLTAVPSSAHVPSIFLCVRTHRFSWYSAVPPGKFGEGGITVGFHPFHLHFCFPSLCCTIALFRKATPSLI